MPPKKDTLLCKIIIYSYISLSDRMDSHNGFATILISSRILYSTGIFIIDLNTILGCTLGL